MPRPLFSLIENRTRTYAIALRTASSIMATTVKDALSRGKLYTDEEKYTFLKLPVTAFREASSLVASSSSSFRGILLDKDEITMMIPESDYESAKKGSLNDAEVGSATYRLITFDVVLDPNLIGFMYTVTKVLADANVSVLPFAAYSRDHVFVQEKDFDLAMATLENLKHDSIDS